MRISLHRNATTTPAIRRAIQTSAASTAERARQYGLALDTVRKWRRRSSVEDRSHTPHRLQTTLNDGQEALTVCLLRTALRLSLDDWLAVVREFIESTMRRVALDRLLRRRGVSRLRDLDPPKENAALKGFKDYEPGFVHIDVKCLPQMKDEDRRRYAFVAIDRATRWVCVRLTRVRRPPVKAPATNGRVEGFNGRIAEVLRSRRFQGRDDLEQTLKRHVWRYNHQLIQKALNHESPIQAMKRWQEPHPHFFVRGVRSHPEPDTLGQLDLYHFFRRISRWNPPTMFRLT